METSTRLTEITCADCGHTTSKPMHREQMLVGYEYDLVCGCFTGHQDRNFDSSSMDRFDWYCPECGEDYSGTQNDAIGDQL